MIFNTKAFAEFNKHKCDNIHYLDYDGISIILGEKEGALYSPFSAPFGGFSSLQKMPSLEQIECACNSLGKLNKKINITFPPPFYGESFISKCTSATLNNGFKMDYADLNYHFDLTEEIKMRHNSKNAWNIAVRNNLRMNLKNDDESMQIAYKIIANNRNERGYPPHLPMEEICETAKATNTCLDCFLVHEAQEPIAAALVFTIEQKRALVVLWGDNRKKKQLHPMTFLAVSMAQHYKSQGYLSLDMGPSSKNGIPNHGLCSFKEGLSCKVTLKLTVKL